MKLPAFLFLTLFLILIQTDCDQLLDNGIDILKQSEYTHTGKRIESVLETKSSVNVKEVFFAKKKYKILILSSERDIPLVINITDNKGNIILIENKQGDIKFDFTPNKTDIYNIEVKVDENSGYHKSCIAVIIGFKLSDS